LPVYQSATGNRDTFAQRLRQEKVYGLLDEPRIPWLFVKMSASVILTARGVSIQPQSAKTKRHEQKSISAKGYAGRLRGFLRERINGFHPRDAV